MIGKLTGTVELGTEEFIFVDVNGVGYKVMTPLQGRPDNLDDGDTVSVFIHTHVREDAIVLYGFFSREALEVFEKLISVNGVGPKLGQTIISVLPANDLRNAVVTEDIARLTSVSGVGKKTAERIILELKTKLTGPVVSVGATAKKADHGAFTDAYEALLALGYSQNEVKAALDKVSKDTGNLGDTSQIIREALKRI